MITDRSPTQTPVTGCQTFTFATNVTDCTPLRCFATNVGGVVPTQFPSYLGQPTFTGVVTQRPSFPSSKFIPAILGTAVSVFDGIVFIGCPR